MGKHEIRLRRKKMTSGRIEGHKNYYEIMRRHKNDMHRKRLAKGLLYIIFILGILLLLYFGFEKINQLDNNDNSGRNTMIISL